MLFLKTRRLKENISLCCIRQVMWSVQMRPSDSDIYTLPTGTSTGEQKVYRLREVIVIGTFTDTTCANIWANDLKTEHLIIHDINTKDTVDRQFKVIKLFFNGGTSIRLKLGA